MSFEQLVQRQYELGNQIQQLARNYAKDPKDRKTSAYYNKKLQNITAWGEEFHTINKAIIALPNVPDDDDYFVTNYHETIAAIVIKHTKLFESEAVKLSNTEEARGGLPPAFNRASGAQQMAATNDQQLADPELRRVLRNQRALVRAINRNIDEILAEKDIDHHPFYYNIQASILEKHMVDFANNNAAIWKLTDDEELEDYSPQTYYDLEARVRSAMIELQRHMKSDETLHPVRATSSRDNDDVRLPRITLPKFEGNYQKWMEFKDLYMELVHHTSVSPARKMHYLTSSLEGEPRNLIKHLPMVGSNYAVAWALITERYDNKRLLASTLLNKLMGQPSIKRETAASIKSLHDTTKECILGLRAQGIPVNHWDVILAHIVLRKLDDDTQRAFEQKLDDNRRLLTIDEVLKFLEHRFQSLEVRGKGDTSSSTRTCASVTKSGQNCQICKKEQHKTYACKTFADAELKKKWKWVKDLNLCVNCLGSGHRASECKARHCTKCPKNHHSMLHNTNANQDKTKRDAPQNVNSAPQNPAQRQNDTSSVQPANKVSLITNNYNKDNNYCLLGTARIKVLAANGQQMKCRAVLDGGSQVNFISERLVKKLGIRCAPTSMQIEGVGANETKLRHQTSIKFQSTVTDYTAEIYTHVIPRIVSDQPMQWLNIEDWDIPKDLCLADPEFYKPGRIDCLLGADIFYKLLLDGKIQLAENLPTLLNTVLGWVVAGEIDKPKPKRAICGICTTHELEEAVMKFWEAEEIPDNAVALTEDELHCESHFLQHTSRSQDGKFIVRLPLKQHPSILAESKGMAYERFKSIERRLINNPSLKEQYILFMREYEALGHMTRVIGNEIISPSYYIPHHCVLRPESTSTKLRVVFDASAHKASELSLNDLMFNGPVVQSDLFAILLRFRMHKYVLKTDIEKMYRQVWVHQDDRNLQLILWRENPNDALQTYQLNTVTYGTRAAPYLATRCLVQLAEETKGQFPYGAAALRKDFYVDDGLTGADTIYEATIIQQQLIKILAGAGMKLKKWCSNDARLLSGIPTEDQEVSLNFDTKDLQSTKTLGLLWLPKSDMFGIKTNVKDHQHTTKRTMSSDLAHIYDPLGLIGPVIVSGKIQLQKTWQQKLDWDEDLPEEIQRQWATYRNELKLLDNITIPRYVFGNQGYVSVELHAFADASEKAYGAAIFIRAIQKDKTTKINLLCSRSRVAPIKSLTIPKLELCAALLAAELMAKVKTDLDYENKPVYYWSDSRIVLSWLHNYPGKLPVFVSHRVVKIRRLSIPDQWRHVPSKENPADVLSRGAKPRELALCNIWFYGPLFLYQPKALWPAPFQRESLFDVEPQAVVLAAHHQEINSAWIYTVPSKNSFLRIQRIAGYVWRFINNARQSKLCRPETLVLTPVELEAALKIIVRQIQESDFTDDKRTLLRERFVPKTNRLSSLAPYIDEEGIIRVGGRLQASLQLPDAKHQMLLPYNDPIVKLLIEKIHKENYHCAPSALLSHVRHRFWPLKGKCLTRSVVQQCVRCTRARPVFFNQFMGSLPAHRVQPARPFVNAGVDFCGPFLVHFKGRGRWPVKAYLAVFCCFATKAVHLELVSDLTTAAFIGALKRFVARRGMCKTLYCDNATNFVGAKNELKELNDIIYGQSAQEDIIQNCSNKGIEFRFIPPRSPHFGGLWEAAVKSAKHLLWKNTAKANLTYEELETIIIEVEAMLNSRPLVPQSSNANDLSAITPGHFLIGEELTSNVDVNATNLHVNLLQRWELVSALKHHFWRRWSSEYLHELQLRQKWKSPVSEILPDTLVILKEDNLPVLKWPLGRIIKTYKGNDGYVRVCDVKTEKGVFTRSIQRLAPLFPQEENSNAAEGKSTSVEDNANSTEDNSNPEKKDQSSTAVSLPVSIPLHRIKNKGLLQPETTTSKRPRLNTATIFTILALCLLPIALCLPVNVTKFNNKPGIYFEKIGSVKLMTATWNMIVYFDMKPYQEQLDTLSDGTASLQKLCDNSTAKVQCDFLLKYFDHITEELQTNFSLLSAKRSKRGAIDFIGNLANSLFGVLDSNYASTMSNTIEHLKKRDDHIEQLFRNQTSLIDSTINVMKDNQANIQAKFDEIDNQIHNLLYSNKPLNELQVEQNIMMLSVEMFMIVSNLQRIHASILDVLIDTHHDKLNPLLLNPEQFHDEILKIRAHLPAHLQLPIHKNNLLEAYKLIKVNGIVAENHIIFCIDLPLTDPHEYNLLHLVPIVAASNKTLTAVQPSANYLAMSPHQDEFFEMQQYQIDSCWTISNGELLCHNIHPTYQVTQQATTNKCEIDLFTERENPRCELKRLDDASVWYSLLQPNQWIFATLNTIKLHAVCGINTIQLSLELSGLIYMEPDCIIKNELITIQGRQRIVTSLQTSIDNLSPSIGWTKQYSQENISLTSFTPSTHEFEQIQRKLAVLTEYSSPDADITSPTHSLITSYAAIGLILIIGSIIFYKWKTLKTKYKPQPTARISTTTNTEC